MKENLGQIGVKQMFKDKSDTEHFDVHKMIKKILAHWWLYVIFLFLTIAGAYLYIRYSTPVYKIQAKILVKDSKKGGDISRTGLFSELDLFGAQNSVDNEVELLKSRTLMEKTVVSLKLNIKYYLEGRIKTAEIYQSELPLIFACSSILEDSLKEKDDITISEINESSFKIKYRSTEQVYKYYDSIKFPFGNVSIFPNKSNYNSLDFPLVVKISKVDNTVIKYRENISVAPTNKTVSTIDLTITDNIPRRGEDILKSILSFYEQLNKEDKNRIADSTIAFIDERLSIVTDELGKVEKNIQSFRQSNELTDIDSQGKLLLDNSNEYVNNLIKQEVQIEIANSLQEYLLNAKNSTRLVPTALSIQDPTLLSLIEVYNTAQIQRDREEKTTGENNPIVQQLVLQIESTRKDLLSTLNSIKKGMTINKNQLQERTKFLEGKIKQVPSTERAFIEFSRQQSIKQELYLYLLKKREETAVSKSANVDNARLVDSPKSSGSPVKPQSHLIYLGSFLLGFIFPTMILYIIDSLNTRVQNKSDIIEKTTAPIIGEIGHSKEKHNVVVKEGVRSVVAEQFRSLRTNLQFLLPEPSDKVILITSNMSGEGKSFVAINLANALALSGKKVVLLEFDLRKPKISKILGINSIQGFSNYAIRKTGLESILIPSGINEDLWVIPAGPLPPNPSELIMRSPLVELFTQLREKFDYVIIDTAPLGLVTDAQLLSTITDISLFIIRESYTFKRQIVAINDFYLSKKLPHLGIVINDSKARALEYGYHDNEYFSKSS